MSTGEDEIGEALRRVAVLTAVPAVGSIVIVALLWGVEVNVVHWADEAAIFVFGSLFGSGAWVGLCILFRYLYQQALKDIRREKTDRAFARKDYR